MKSVLYSPSVYFSWQLEKIAVIKFLSPFSSSSPSPSVSFTAHCYISHFPTHMNPILWETFCKIIMIIIEVFLRISSLAQVGVVQSIVCSALSTISDPPETAVGADSDCGRACVTRGLKKNSVNVRRISCLAGAHRARHDNGWERREDSGYSRISMNLLCSQFTSASPSFSSCFSFLSVFRLSF